LGVPQHKRSRVDRGEGGLFKLSKDYLYVFDAYMDTRYRYCITCAWFNGSYYYYILNTFRHFDDTAEFRFFYFQCIFQYLHLFARLGIQFKIKISNYVLHMQMTMF